MRTASPSDSLRPSLGTLIRAPGPVLSQPLEPEPTAGDLESPKHQSSRPPMPPNPPSIKAFAPWGAQPVLPAGGRGGRASHGDRPLGGALLRALTGTSRAMLRGFQASDTTAPPLPWTTLLSSLIEEEDPPGGPSSTFLLPALPRTSAPQPALPFPPPAWDASALPIASSPGLLLRVSGSLHRDHSLPQIVLLHLFRVLAMCQAPVQWSCGH